MAALRTSGFVISQIEELRKTDDSDAVAVVRALTEVIKRSQEKTIMGLRAELQREVEELKQTRTTSSMSLASGCELFMRFVTRTALDISVFEECKLRLIERGEQFTQRLTHSRDKIASLAGPFIQDGATILVHGFSRVVLCVLQKAAAASQQNGMTAPFTVICTECRPDSAGYLMAASLRNSGIPVEIIMDSAVGTIMDRVSMVLCGSEAIVENGGIINKVGTYQISIVAHELGKPFYVAAESFKFFRLYPLNQREIPQRQGSLQLCDHCTKLPRDVTLTNPMVDYTPPSYITLLFTELGVLPPAAVSDELIRLYAY